MLVGSLWNVEDCPLVCVNHRWGWLPLSGLLFRPLLKPAGFPYAFSHRMDKAGRGLSGIIWSNLSAQATLVGGYAVVISWEGVEIDDYPGTALLRPVFATMTRRRQKARETDYHSISTKSTELLGALLNADGMKERKLFLPRVFATRWLSQTMFSIQSCTENQGEEHDGVWNAACHCLPKLPCKQDVRILPPQWNLSLMPPKARLGFC